MGNLKDGMVKVDWMYISPKVQVHCMCSVAHCYNDAEYMKKAGSKQYYRVYCREHASK